MYLSPTSQGSRAGTTTVSGVDSRASVEELSAAVLAVAAHRSVVDVLQTIVSTARALLDAEYAALGVPDDQGGFAEFVVDGISDEEWAAIGPLPRQHGMLGVMLSDPAPQRLADLRSDPRFNWWPTAHPHMGAFLGMPVLDGDEILGAIYLANPLNHAGSSEGGGSEGGSSEGGSAAPSKREQFTEDDERLLGVLASHAAIALTNARLFEQARELTLIQERQRIAHDLHDVVAQTLFSLRLSAQAAAAMVRSDPDRAATELDTVAELAGSAAEELRQIVSEMRPPELTHAGLAETLRGRIALLDRVHGASISFDLRSWRETAQSYRAAAPSKTALASKTALSHMTALSHKTEEAVLRVAEEALHNALQHGDATRVTVTLTGTEAGAVLEVTDDGAGFDTKGVGGASNRLGLASMRERSRAVRGTLTINSTVDQGTTVRLEVPGVEVPGDETHRG
jgi:signal transduction histidine kinase